MTSGASIFTPCVFDGPQPSKKLGAFLRAPLRAVTRHLPRIIAVIMALPLYWSALATVLKVPCTVVPMLLTPAIIRMERKPAIRAYSMEVTPVLSFTKRKTSFGISGPAL
jgi:hypothetical protein